MSRLTEIVRECTDLSDGDLQRLSALVNEWNILADLSFSDLILWVPDRDPEVFRAVAQIRPTTGPTALEDDVIGDDISYDHEHLVTEAFLSHVICETSNNQLGAGIPVDTHAIPVMCGERCIGVVEQHTNRMGTRAPGALEEHYVETAGVLADMVWRGVFPLAGEPSTASISPRVGDGMMRIDERGVVSYASPNAVSAYRRMGLVGDLEGESLADLVRTVAGNLKTPVDETAAHNLLTQHVQREFEVEGSRVSIRMRVVPLRMDDEPVGLLMLCRDTSELRSRERQLVTKDATIREIHHRVKNNLQTVAALLRLQSRRITSPEAKGALNDAMSRVAAIAVVHEILSQGIDEVVTFDEVTDRMLRMVGDLAATQGDVRATRQGSFGLVPASAATSLALVVTELCQNAIEHGYGSASGTVTVVPARDGGTLQVDVLDDGAGLPEGFDLAASRSLGLAIVRTLVSDLEGRFALLPNPAGRGTMARVTIPLDGERVA